ncbi:MAG: oligosaccharide flippase family protein [Anaerolineaceae bacterium]|nr:oligosaccharide flippase family protein [Anaerolineaceae bacterium]
MMLQRFRHLLQRKFVQDTLVLQASRIGITLLGMITWVIVPVVMGSEHYGAWGLVQSFLATWQALDLTGLSTSTSVLLATAVGAKDTGEIQTLMAVFVKVSLAWAVLSISVLGLAGPLLAGRLYAHPTYLIMTNPLAYRMGDTSGGEIGVLAALLALSLLFDPFYNLVLMLFRSRRAMRTVAIIQNVNQGVLSACLVTAALINPTPAALVIARLVYSAVTMVLALAVYTRLRLQGDVPFPPIQAVLAQVWNAPYRRYWRFGTANAIDKNLADLYIQIPIQMTGILAGNAAVGYVQLALRGIQQTGLFTSAIFENMQAVVPQAVGRGDYARLWRNFSRVLLVLLVGGAAFYLGVALFAPLIVVPLFGDEWQPTIPLIGALAVYGSMTMVGGIFGPLYRAFHIMQRMIVVKVVSLALLLPVGLLLITVLGALGGVWMINGLFTLSVILTAATTLPELRRRAREQVAG